MSNLHDRIERDGRDAVLATARTAKERRMIAAAAEMMAQEKEEVGYLHSGFCMAALPHRRPKNDLVPWSRVNGNFELRVTPGEVRVRPGEWRPVGIPYGTKARLILIYLQSEAVRKRERVVAMGESMTDWMHAVGLTVQGGLRGTIGPVKEQALRVCCCSFKMVWTGENGAEVRRDRRLIEGDQLWFPEDPRQGLLFPSYIELAPHFYDDLLEHAVPLDENAVRHLKGSSLALDLYVWLAHRLHRVSGKAQVPWAALEKQLGSEFKERGAFAHKVRQVLPEVLAVYREAKVEVQAQGLLLQAAPPPVARRTTVVGIGVDLSTLNR